ncbi:MAG: fibronectin type III domain-containing protein [Lachnobacterium sp.]|nr:fibronectin type III domain-containing protein [Lachnobacterium sp.]
MIFSRNKGWISVVFFAVVAATCVIAPQTAKADVKIEPDGVMGQSVVDETIYDPAEDYVWLSSNIEAPAQFSADDMPMLRAATYTKLFLESSFTTVSDLNNSTYYHDSVYEDCEILNGIDVSWWQGGGKGSTTSKINWKKMHAAGADFAFVRAASRDTADGSIYEDTTASAHINGAQANKMNVGLYIFSQAVNSNEAVEEADYVLNLIDQYDWDIDMPIIIDREAGRMTKRLTNAKLSKAKETAVVQAFADEITSAGYKAGVYASYSWYKDKMNADDLEDCAIWIARYNNMTTSNAKSGTPYADVLCDYEFWQYSSQKPSASTGYTSNLDVDFWYKDTNVTTENLTMSKNTANTITLAWDDADDADAYRVYRYNEGTGKYDYLATTSDTGFTDTNLQPGTNYQYKVRCVWTIGGNNYYGTYSSALTAPTLPAQVTNVRVDKQTGKTVSLAWDSVNGADGYRIYRYNSDSDSYEELDTVGADRTSYEVTGLASACEYRFKIRASKTMNANTYWGEYSEKVVAVTKPDKVAELSARTLGASEIELTWKKSSHVTGYQIYRLDGQTGKYVKIATVEESMPVSYTDCKLSAATEYSYKVRAYKNFEGTSYYGSFSNVKSQVTKPDKVQRLKASTKASAVTLKWAASENVTGYQIYRLNTKTKKYEKIATINGADKITYKNKSLKKGKTYRYKIRAYKKYNGTTYYGGFSSVSRIKVK